MLKKRNYLNLIQATPASSLRKNGRSLALLTFLLLANMGFAVADENPAVNNASQTTKATDEATPATGTKQTPTQQEAANMGSVARAVFTTQIVDREPTDDLTILTNDKQRIYYFTDLRGLAGQIITHQWEYNGKVMAEVKFKVGEGPRWRVYSSKNLLPEWTGEWKVSVIDESGHTLTTSSFEYKHATTQDQPAESEQPGNNSGAQ